MSFQDQWLNMDNTRAAERISPRNPEFSPTLISGVSSILTTDAPATVIAAQGSGNCIYVTDILVTNASETVGTYVEILNGSAVIWKGYAAVGSGFIAQLRTPLRLTANTALRAKNVTDASETIVSASGYVGI